MAIVTGDPNLEQISPDGAEADTSKAIEGRSLRQIAMGRLRRDKFTLAAIALSVVFLLIALVTPMLDSVGILDPYSNHQNLLNVTSGNGVPFGSLGGVSASHPLGVVPSSGTDLLSRVMLGITFSVVVGLGATVVAILVGLVLGLIAGYAGGRADFLISRFTDLVLCFPQTLMLLALSNSLIGRLVDLGVPAGNVSTGLYVILVMGGFGWPTFARIIRGQVMTLRSREFIEAARSLGASNRRIYITELLPNLWAPILVYTTIMFPVFVSGEAALSYLGVGIKPPTPTLGNIISDSVGYAQTDPMYFFVPIITIVLIVLSFNLVGDGLRDALDPKADRH